ncbi:MAG: Bro-N domain-containing protein [Roseburia sp.]|nr:Bro-N domain-containing protein [Roseburia sp.]
MNDLQVFNNAEFGSIRTVTIDGEPWFVGKDVAAALGYKDTADALKKHVDSEDKLTRRFADSGQNREMYIINESGLYALIFGSKLESAKQFKHWVTSEVLPILRKTGRYEIPETAATVETIEPTRPLTTDDYIRSANIAALAKKETLPYVLHFLTKAGIEIPKVEEFKPLAREFEVNTSVTEYLKGHDVENRVSGEVYRDYVDFCCWNNIEPLSHIVFSKQVNKLLNTRVVAVKICGKTTRMFRL